MKSNYPVNVWAMRVGLMLAIFGGFCAEAALVAESDINVSYSEDGKKAKLRLHNNWVFFSIRFTVTDANDQVCSECTVGPKSWSSETDYILLPCRIHAKGLPPSSGGEWSKTIEPRIETGNTNSSGQFEKPSPYDRLHMKNGDIISGTIVNEKVSIKTSYALLTFTPDELVSIEMEGAGANIDKIAVRTGDKISGVLETLKFKVKLASGVEVELDKDKVKVIRFREKPSKK